MAERGWDKAWQAPSHIMARYAMGSPGDRHPQTPAKQFNPIENHGIKYGVVIGRHIGLDTMGKRVHTGGGGKK